MTNDHKARIQARFGSAAPAYITSATHAAGDDLAQLVAWAEGGPQRVALDIATGGGHTALALAPLVGRVVATDLTDEMLRHAEAFIRGQGVSNVEFQAADAEDLPFPDEVFDLVSCRIAPHHFSDVARFVREVARVLKRGGVFLLEDSLAPDDPECAAVLNRVEVLRDPTHVRTLTAAEWRQLLRAAALTIEAERVFPKTHAWDSWFARAQTPEPVQQEIATLLREAPARIQEALALTFDSTGRVVSLTDQKIAFKARRLTRSPVAW